LPPSWTKYEEWLSQINTSSLGASALQVNPGGGNGTRWPEVLLAVEEHRQHVGHEAAALRTHWRVNEGAELTVHLVRRIDAIWLATAPPDMRAGADTTLAWVVQVFGSAGRTMPLSLPTPAPTGRRSWCRMASLWLLARRLHQERFVWPAVVISMPLVS
jgi:hypothetical protein